MTTIYARALDQVLTATLLPPLACNNRKSVKLHVEFDSVWNGYAKSALFYTSNDPTVYPEVLDFNGECTIPHEVLTDQGRLFITIQGINSSIGALKSTTPISYKILPGTPSLVVSDPSPSVYEQLVTRNKVLEARMNTFASLKDGSTTGDAELADIRVGSDGETYDNAGEAVRGQILSVRDGTLKENLIDLKSMSPGFIQATGAFTFSHRMGTYYRWEMTTDFIPVTPSLPYMLTIIHDNVVAGWYAIYLYDDEKNYLEYRIASEYNNSEFCQNYTFSTYKANVAYVRISYRSYGTAKVKFEQSTYATKIEPEAFNNNLMDVCPLEYEGFILDNGSISSQTTEGYAGEGEPALEEKYSRHIPVISGEKYTLYQIAKAWAWCAIGIYDSDGKGISRLTTNDTKFDFTIPEGAVTMIVCARTHYLNDLALFKKGEMLCGEQRVRENYLNLNKINETPICAFDDIVKAVNHRGYINAPENTLSAFRLSKEKGFKYVECDVSFTSDGYAVLLHDATVDRTSNGTGSINAMTLEEVRALDFGSWKSEEYAGEKIPRFEEFIALCRNLGLHPYIELKEGNEAQIKGLVDVVKHHGMKGKVTWISFNSAYLGYVKAIDTSARLGFVVDAVSASTINTVKQTLRTGKNEVFIDCAASNTTNEIATLCANADIPLEVWTVNDKNSIKVLDAYVSGVTSDNLIASKVLADNEINA